MNDDLMRTLDVKVKPVFEIGGKSNSVSCAERMDRSGGANKVQLGELNGFRTTGYRPRYIHHEFPSLGPMTKISDR